MEISARIRNAAGRHEAEVTTAGAVRPLAMPARASGRGSAVNGGELLALALATCYCNDLYREAERLGIELAGCDVVATTHFDGIGCAAGSVVYAARIDSTAPPADIERLLSETDRLAEVHETLRTGCEVRRVAWPTSG